MRHEFHTGGFVSRDAVAPVLFSSGCCGLLAAQMRERSAARAKDKQNKEGLGD